MSEEFQCAACGEVFRKAWSDEEVLAERTELFPTLQPENAVVVCDVCFPIVMKANEAEAL